MCEANVNDCVRLTHDVPQLSLSRGAIGVVRSTWFAPSVANEVEFRGPNGTESTRALLQPEQLEVSESDHSHSFVSGL